MNINCLHHFAYRCRDAEETRHFYEDILGLPLTHVIRLDHVPSTGEFCPYVHVFFQMRDGSYIAFFDLGDDVKALPSPNTPAWVNHLALEVDSENELLTAKKRLEEAGVEVLGITDHHFIHSIYFFDPNGIRLELTVRAIENAELERLGSNAHEQLAAWNTEKTAARAAQARATKPQGALA
jgi:catechol 2,3-dioxygenase-like lactoylglutathione lyase family enzyme